MSVNEEEKSLQSEYPNIGVGMGLNISQQRRDRIVAANAFAPTLDTAT